MAYEERDLQGSLFINKKREKDSHPNMRGSVTVGGRKYWVSAWTKHKQSDGEKWLSLALTPAEETNTYTPRTNGVIESDDVPF